MPSNTRAIMHTVSYVAFCIALFTASLLNPGARFLLLLLSFAFLSNYTVHTFFFGEKPRSCLLSSLGDLVLICMMSALDSSGATLFLTPFLIGDAILDLPFRTAAWVVCADFGVSLALLYRFLHGQMALFLPFLFLCTAVFLLFSLIFWLIRRLRTQNERLEQTLRESMVKKVEAQARGRDLETAYKQAIEASAANERNRIAREIHDTVGHTLTTVLVELEASRRLSGRDPDRAMEKLALAQEQVRDGLQAIRASVRMLEENRPLLNPYDAMDALLREFAAHTGVAVTNCIERSEALSPQTGEILYACLREGLTNSLRSGHCTAITCALAHGADGVCFSLTDNGVGATVVTPGFGLRAIQSSLDQAGGSLQIQTERGHGFTLRIRLPARQSCR